MGPRLIFPDGSYQPSTFGFPSVFKEFANLLNLDRWVPKGGKLGLFLGRHFGSRFPNLFSMYLGDTGPRPVPALFGSCILIRREAWESVGGMDPGFFLYWEEA